MKKLFLFIFLGTALSSAAQQLAPLTVEKIMRDPQWMGVSPSNVQWSPDGKALYFNWNPENKDRDPLYVIRPAQSQPHLAAPSDRLALNRNNLIYNKARTKVLFERNGDLVLFDLARQTEKVLVSTIDRESSAVFSADESSVIFQRAENLYKLSLGDGSLLQLSNLSRSRKRPEGILSKQDQWLKNDQLATFEYLRKEEQETKWSQEDRRLMESKRPKEFILDDKMQLNNIRLSPAEKYIAFRISRTPEGNQNTIVPNFITASGYVEDIPGRTKVGNALPVYQSYIYDSQRDTIYAISTKEIPGIKDLPDYVKDYPKQLEERTKKNEERKVAITGPYWNEDGSQAVVVVFAQDNKDRWIMKLDQASGKLSLLDRQRDEAWIAGPGIGGSFGGGSLGWSSRVRLWAIRTCM